MTRSARGLHHEVLGAGPPLLLGAALGSTLAMWDRNVARLSADHRVIRFDQRGHGGSPMPRGPYSIADLGQDVLGLMDRLGLERSSYCGLSMGGMVGIWLAAYAPDRIDRLIVACSSAFWPPASDWAETAARVRDAGTTAVVADAVFPRWVTDSFAAANPEVVHTLRAMLLSIDPEGFATGCEAIGQMDLRDELKRIASPTLVVAGSHDIATPPDRGREIVASIADAHFVTLPGAHLANVECSNAFCDVALDHLRA